MMKIYRLARKQFLPITLTQAWDFFSSPKNLGKITPAHMNFQILSQSGGERMHEGQIIRYKVTVLPLVRLTWVTEITGVTEGQSFTDEQRKGPYRLWRHTHTFREQAGGVEMTDVVEYSLPFGLLGRLAHWLFVEREVNRIFDHRFTVLQTYFQKS
jgi:ligand-binding SRPBCC domain-containing protein